MAELGAIGRAELDTLNLSVVATLPLVTITGESAHGGPGLLSGVTRNDHGALASRKLCAYRRKTGEFVDATTSNASTGAWQIATRYLEDHVIVCQDDDAGTLYNDLVLRAAPVQG